MIRFLSVLFLLPSITLAQPADSLSRALNKFSNGSAIQVNESRGHFFGVKNSAIVFEDRSSVREIPFSTVDELWKQSSHWKTGAVTGAIITGVSFAAIGALLVNVTCENSDTHCRGDYPIVTAYGLVLGGAGGGLVGGLIGYAFKTWKRVY
jgi:hypothetical protein